MLVFRLTEPMKSVETMIFTKKQKQENKIPDFLKSWRLNQKQNDKINLQLFYGSLHKVW